MNRRKFLSLSATSVMVPLADSVLAEAKTSEFVQEAFPPVAEEIDFESHAPVTGTFPVKWIAGSSSCMDNQDAPIQVHWYNEHTAILRQNKAYNYEAPFMMLYFGNERILLLDEGYTQLRSNWPLRDVVDDCISTWCRRHGRKVEDMALLVSFSHLHDDHYAAINQFFDRPNTRYMGLTHEEMIGFWGMTHYPEEQVRLDLGGRALMIWGNPGHVRSEFAYYDTYTGILYTGDMFYRGRCYISFWDKWFASMERVIAFVDTHPVTHVMGCHVEISRTGQDYPYGISWQPDEAPVQMTVTELRRAYEVAKTVKEPGIYFTGTVFLCNQTRGKTTIDRNPYAYD